VCVQLIASPKGMKQNVLNNKHFIEILRAHGLCAKRRQQNLLRWYYREEMTTVDEIHSPQAHVALVQVLEGPNGICSGLQQSNNAGRVGCVQKYNSNI
jgi:hypothetical protein